MPSTPGNGSLVQFESAEVGAEVTYQCNPGFIPAAPQLSVCAQDRTWSPDPSQLVCQEPPPSGDYWLFVDGPSPFIYVEDRNKCVAT